MNYGISKDNTADCVDAKNDSCNIRAICYEFGLSKIYTILIKEKDETQCDVYISDNTGQIFLTTCINTPILQWAFDEMSDEMINTKYVVDNEYKPFYYQLSLKKNGDKVVVSSSTMQIIDEDKLTKKIDELKSFIIKIWYAEYISR